MRVPYFLRKILKTPRNRGTSLIELVVYIAILIVMTVIILRAVLQLTAVFARSRIERRVSLAAETALERIVREIRLGASVNCLAPDSNFVCGSSSGSAIRLYTYDSFTNPTPNNVYKSFYCLSSGSSCTQIMFDPGTAIGNSNNMGDDQPLTPNTVTVDSLVFKRLYNNPPPNKTEQAPAVRIELTVSSGLGSTKVTHTYYALAVLRGYY